MSLSLPADAEPFIPDGGDLSDLHGSGCYALTLTKPDDLATAWDREFDHRPPYFEELQEATEVIYVGAAKDVLRRLEEHRDGEVRVGVLQSVCEIESLRSIWWYQSAEKAFEEESALGIMLNNHTKASTYVHQR